MKNCPMRRDIPLTDKQIENFCRHGCSPDCGKLLQEYLKRTRRARMKKYYFTFGGGGQVYRGGWVEIHADSLLEAQRKFVDHFGDRAYKSKGVLNYSWNYTEESFKKTIMYEDNNNLGAGCHEIIK